MIDVRRHTLGAALVGLSALALSAASPPVQFTDPESDGDIPLYQRYGDKVREGLIPYGDFYTEYPPFAVPIFVVPTIGPSDDYIRNSKLTELALAAIALLIVVLLAARFGRPPLDLYVAAIVIGISPAVLGRVSLTRFDFWPAMITAAALAFAVAGRVRLAGGTLALATLAKVYPAVLLPLFVLRAAREQRRSGAYRSLIAFSAVMVAVLVPLAAVGAGGLRFTFLQQIQRPVQIESTAASLLLALGQLDAYEPKVVFTHSSHNLDGIAPEILGSLFALAGIPVLFLLWR